MWRDVLIVVGFALAALNYFGLSPRRILGYTTTAKAEVAKRRPYQRVFLFFAIVASGFCVRLFILMFQRKDPLEYFLFTIVLLFIFWDSTLHDVWKVSEGAEKILYRIRWFGIFPLFITSVVLWDMPLWQKIVYPVGGWFAGMGTAKLSGYIDRKRKGKRSSKS